VTQTATLPTRPLGRTGIDITVFSLGGVKYNQLHDAEAAAVVGRAIDLGVNYIDTAHGYKDSERKIGLVTADRRDEVFLATKTPQRSRDGAMRAVEESLKRLRTDRVDVVQIHDLYTEQQLAEITGPNGALKAFEALRDAGAVRFIGVTGHRRPEVLTQAMREYPFDTLLVSVGPMQRTVRPFYHTVMPVARQRGVGVIGMKVVAAGLLREHAEASLRFVATLPGVASALVGVDSVEQLERNVAVVRDLQPLSDAERDALLTAARAIHDRRPEDAWFFR